MINFTVLFPPDIFAFFIILSIRGVTVHLDYLSYCDQFLITMVRIHQASAQSKERLQAGRRMPGLKACRPCRPQLTHELAAS